MSRDITVNVQRAGGTTHVYSNVAMQLDTMSQTESAYYGGTAPYRRFYGFILANLDIRHEDLLIDVRNVNPDTGVNAQYRVVNNPDDDTFIDMHMELVVDRVEGT
jgi:hypothetical protein